MSDNLGFAPAQILTAGELALLAIVDSSPGFYGGDNYASKEGIPDLRRCPVCGSRSVREKFVCSQICSNFLEAYGGDELRARHYYRVWEKDLKFWESDLDNDRFRSIKIVIESDDRIRYVFGEWEYES